MDKQAISTKTIVYASIIAALYYVMVIGLAPVSFDILQFRFANILKSLAVLNPAFSIGYAIGDFFANQLSPFGILDWGIMPIFDFVGAISAYVLRKRIWLAVIVQSLIIAVGVATFPLGLGGNLPWLMSFISVFISSLLIISAGSIIILPIVKKGLKNVRT